MDCVPHRQLLTKLQSHNKRAHKANRVIGIIKKSFHCIDKIMFRTLYVSLVRSYLEYALQIWNPHLLGDIQVVKKVQKRATKFIPDLRQLTYSDRLVAPVFCTDEEGWT